MTEYPGYQTPSQTGLGIPSAPDNIVPFVREPAPAPTWPPAVPAQFQPAPGQFVPPPPRGYPQPPYGPPAPAPWGAPGVAPAGPPAPPRQRSAWSAATTALVALLVVLLAVLGGAAYVLLTRQPSLPVVTSTGAVNPTAVATSSLQVGDCIYNVSGITDAIDSVDVVDCATPHEAEVYATEAGAGDNVFEALAGWCEQQFEPYFGVAYKASALNALVIHAPATEPTTDVACVAYLKGSFVDSSLKGSRR